ncbi:MAG: peptide-N-glycosidase F-related protein, partial [Bacteroidota bacterium]
IWQHFAFVYDGTHVYLYLNGTLVSSIAASGSFATTIMPFDIGLCPLSGFNFYYNGGIDEVSLWKKALTASQIQNIMTHEISVDSATAQGLLLYYKFNQGIPGSNNTSITKLHTEVNSPIYDGVINNFTMTGVVSNFEGTIDTSSQIITFSTIPTKLINSPPFVLTATASSGLTVGYNIVSGPAILSGDTVILAGTPGTVVIKAYQHGNAQYDSATSIINSFDVVDPNINVPKIDPRHPLAGNVHVTPPLSKIQLAAIATINYTPLFSVQSVSFKIDGQTPTIPTTDFGNGCYTAWWQPSGYGSHTVEILATNNYGAVSDTTFDINIDSTATDTTYQAFSSIWVNSNVPSFVVDGELPSFLGAYDTIIATLSITCPTGGCDPWDRISSVEAKSHEGNWFEIIRYITPYGIACTHKIVLTDYESLLKGKVSFRVNLGTLGNGYLYTLKFDYKKGTPPHKYSQVTNIWENNYNFGYYPNLQPVSVFNYTFPSGVVSSKLKLISTGHGSGSDNTNNAAEFYEATHHIHINNVDSFAQHNWVTCNPNPDNCSPQNGTWQYSRAGWCPGSIAHPFDYNLTTYIPSNNIAIKYVLFPGYIDMCSPAYPPCVSGTTCTDCSGGTIPILDVDCNLVNFFDNPPGNPVIQAVKELKDFEIAVYPNPSTGIFNLTSNNKPENVCNVTIYNLFGNHVKEFQWNGENTTFNLSNNAAGIYIMKVSNKDKVEIKKLMVR